MQRLRVAVFASGSGSNMQAIVDAVESGSLDIDVAACVSNKADAGVLVRAKKHSIPTIVMDPRVTTAAADLDEIFSVSRAMYYAVADAGAAIRHATDLHDQIAAMLPRASGSVADTLSDFDARVLAIRGEPVRRQSGRRNRRRGGEAIPATLVGARGAVSSVMNSLQRADVALTTVQRNALIGPRDALTQVMADWTVIATTERAALNEALRAANLPEVTLDPGLGSSH